MTIADRVGRSIVFVVAAAWVSLSGCTSRPSVTLRPVPLTGNPVDPATKTVLDAVDRAIPRLPMTGWVLPAPGDSTSGPVRLTIRFAGGAPRIVDARPSTGSGLAIQQGMASEATSPSRIVIVVVAGKVPRVVTAVPLGTPGRVEFETATADGRLTGRDVVFRDSILGVELPLPDAGYVAVTAPAASPPVLELVAFRHRTGRAR